LGLFDDYLFKIPIKKDLKHNDLQKADIMSKSCYLAGLGPDTNSVDC